MEQVPQNILSYDQYAQIERRGFAMPYIVELQKENRKLLFYGAEHENDPEHPQFKDIENRWAAFLGGTDNPIALVEGRFDEVPPHETTDRDVSIVAGGEAQFVVYLARRDGVEVVSPEPDRVWEATELANEFGRKNVALFYFIRQISWWNRLAEKPDMQAEAGKMLGLMRDAYKWQDVDFSMEGMDNLYKELRGKPLPWDDAKEIYDLTTPAQNGAVTNMLARRSGELRDAYIFSRIQGYWESDRSPFAIFGSAHAICLEPALRKLGGQDT